MTTMSAAPARLGSFVDEVTRARASTVEEHGTLAGLATAVTRACPGRAVDVPAIAALSLVLEHMATNEKFVATVRDAVVAADATVNGVATVDVSSVDLALQAAGLAADPPVPVEFEPTTREVQAPTSGMIDDPINAANGNMIHRDLDVELPAIAAALNIERTWNSLLAEAPGAFGAGWASVLDAALEVSAGRVTASLADGNVITFVPWRDGWAAPGVPRLQLSGDDNGWSLRTDPLTSFEFDGGGALTGWAVGVARVAVRRDDADRIVRLDEAVSGRTLRIRWSPASVVDEVVVDDGRSVRYRRDGDGRLVTATSAAGSVEYRWDGRLLRAVVDADGVAAFVNEYDDEGRVRSQTSPFGRVSTYRYDDTGLTVFSDAAGVVQAMRHDRWGNLTAMIDVDGSALRMDYDEARRVVKVVERDGATWRYRYDGEDLVERVDPDGLSQRWTWDASHRLVESVDRAGAVTRYRYDTDHRAPSRVVGPAGEVVTQTLDERGLPLEIVDADGVVTTLRWDRDGQLAASLDAFGEATTFDYDAGGRLARITPPWGAPTVLDHDDHGRLVRTERGDAVWEYGYTAAGRVCRGVEPGDVAWSATFGTNGALETMTDAVGSTARFAHDAIGNVTQVTAPDGAVYRHVYDEVGRLVAAVEPTGATTAKVYDRRGRPVEVTDARGSVWRRRVDELGRTVASTAPDGAETAFTYHPDGQLASVTGPDGREWCCEIDPAGRPVAMTDPAGGRSLIEYTPAGRVRRRTSPAGRREEMEYDAAGRLAAVIGVDGTRRSVGRDPRGWVTSVLEHGAGGGLRRTEHRWDDCGRLIGLTADGADGSRAWSLRRDAGGRLVEAVDPTGVTTRYEWDRRGLLAAASDPTGLTTRYRHDARGRLVDLATPGGRTTSLGYGPDGHTASITDPAGVVTRFTRDGGGLLTGVRNHDGTGWDRQLDEVGRETMRLGSDGTVAGRYTYDDGGRLVDATVPGSDVALGFLWDDNDRIAAVTTGTGTHRLERDADGRVTATVDPDGNRTPHDDDEPGDPLRDRAGRLTIGPDGTVFRYDEVGRIAEIAPDGERPTSFTYDPDGLVATERGPSGTRRYRYDPAGRVIAMVVEGVGAVRFVYDRCGRRIRDDRSDGTATVYRWDVFGRLQAIERHDETGAVVGEIAVAYDALDRPVVVDGRPVDYEPTTGLPDDGPWTPGGDRPLGGTLAGDVWLVGARVLDPETHQFLSTDPLLPVPGSNGASSAYTYCWNDPVNWVDPTGMRPLSTEEFAAVMAEAEETALGKAWDAIREDPWGTLAMVGVTALGVGLCATGVGTAVGAGILIGVGASAGIGLATGTFSPRMVAVNGVVGGLSGGLGGAITTTSWQGAVALGASTGAGETVVGSLLAGQGFPSSTELLVGTATGGLVSGGASTLRQLQTPGATIVLDHAPTTTGPRTVVTSAASATSKVDEVIAETSGATRRNLTSAHVLSADEALEAGERWIGEGYVELGKPGSGVFRSADGTSQFRMDGGSLLGNHAPHVPHVHLETYATGARIPSVNNHVPFVE